MNWPPAAWEAMDRLARLDLQHYTGHVFDREAFLGKARANRVTQHQALIDGLLAGNPNTTADDLLTACNPAPLQRPEPFEAKRRDYDTIWPTCQPCDSLGRVPLMVEGVERWAPCPECHPRRKSA